MNTNPTKLKKGFIKSKGPCLTFDKPRLSDEKFADLVNQGNHPPVRFSGFMSCSDCGINSGIGYVDNLTQCVRCVDCHQKELMMSILKPEYCVICNKEIEVLKGNYYVEMTPEGRFAFCLECGLKRQEHKKMEAADKSNENRTEDVEDARGAAIKLAIKLTARTKTIESKCSTIFGLIDSLCHATGMDLPPDHNYIRSLDDVIIYLKAVIDAVREGEGPKEEGHLEALLSDEVCAKCNGGLGPQAWVENEIYYCSKICANKTEKSSEELMREMIGPTEPWFDVSRPGCDCSYCRTEKHQGRVYVGGELVREL